MCTRVLMAGHVPYVRVLMAGVVSMHVVVVGGIVCTHASSLEGGVYTCRLSLRQEGSRVYMCRGGLGQVYTCLKSGGSEGGGKRRVYVSGSCDGYGLTCTCVLVRGWEEGATPSAF